MQTIPFSEREIELAIELNKKGIIWRPKSSDWFIDLNNLRVLYNGEFVQSESLCLVIDEDGRSFSFLELVLPKLLQDEWEESTCDKLTQPGKEASNLTS